MLYDSRGRTPPLRGASRGRTPVLRGASRGRTPVLRGASRREVIRGAAAALVLPAGPALAQGRPVKIGYVTPQSGPLAAFAEADAYVLGVMRDLVAKGLRGAGGAMPVTIEVRDSQSSPNRAAEVARELIVDEEVHLVLVASTPETTNPVSTQCEIEGVPCISTVAPWQPWYIGRQAKPGDPASWEAFAYTYHFFWGLEDVIATFLGMWGQVETNKAVGGLFPNDGDGNAWGDKTVGLPPALGKAGYRTTDPGRYQNLSDDFTAQIGAFKQAGAEIVTGVVLPPDFTTFWKQAAQQGFRPKVASIAKAILFPSSVEALGRGGHNLSSEVWWTPSHPFRSSLTGASAADIAQGFTGATGRPWTQPIGFTYALFEVALDVLKRAADPTDRDAVNEAVRATDLATVVGRVNWGKDALPGQVARNVSKTPLVGGQWQLRDDAKFDLVVVENGSAPEIPLGGAMKPITA